MALTLDEQENVNEAELEELSFKIIGAIQEQDVATFDDCTVKLEQFRDDITVPFQLRSAARNILEDAALNMTASGIAQMTKVVDGLAQAGSGLRSAIRIAENGKEELFFPSVAAAAQRALSVLKAFKQTADTLVSEGANTAGVEQSLDAVVASLTDLKSAIDAAR